MYKDSSSVEIQKHLFILHKYFGWTKPNSMAIGQSQHHSQLTQAHLTNTPH
jgi:hypothetical protein